MASLHLSKRRRVIMLVLALIAVISTVIFSVAVFTDRVNRTTTIQVSTFDDDGYAIERTAPDGYFTAGETVEVTLKESNSKSENITSQITMTVAWDCPVPGAYPWGNTALGNAVITLDGDPVTYTVNADQTISFTLPKKALAAKSTDVESILKFQIPSDLAATGKLSFNFDAIELGYASWTTDYDRTDLSSLNFGVGVAWNVSKKQTTSTGNPNRDVIAILTEGAGAGQYGLEIIKNGSDDNTNNGQMMDWAAKDLTPWASYHITDLTLDEGVTSVGDYAFAGETGITALNFPSTMAVIGTSAFDGIGLSGELVIPASIQKIESLAFGNLPNVTAITFEHTSGDALDLPNNTSAGKETSGAFYVPNYVKTTFIFNGNSNAEKYNWVADNRMKVGITEAELTYEDVVIGQTVDPGLVIKPDNYEPYQSIHYEVFEGSEFASVDPDTGVVTGLKQGNAIVQVTIVDANGDTVTTKGTVKVLGISITDATLAYDDVVVGQTVDPDLKLLPENHGPYQSIEYEVTKGSKYASVDSETGVVTGLKQGTATVKVTIIDTNGIEVTAEAEVKVLGIGITKATLNYDDVVVGQTVDPDLKLLPENHDPYQSIKYEIMEGETYAKVNSKTGIVTGLKQGTATVKVTIIDTNGIEVTAMAKVNVLGIGITKVTLDYDDVVVGETVDPDLGILPENHDKYQSIKYEVVSGGQYASVDTNTGVVTGLKQGIATVKVTVVDTNGDEASAEAVVNVLGIGITDVTLDYDDVVVGETVDPDLDIRPDDYDDYQSIEYEIVDGEEYASVDPDTGEVTGLKQGTATVKVTIIDTNGDEISDEAEVNILGIGITKVTLDYDDVVVGETVDPDLDIQPDDYDDYQSIEYEIVDGEEFAKVDPDTGEVTGLKQGTATVKVTIIDTNGDEISDEAEVNILGIGITDVTLDYDDVVVGETVDPDLDIQPDDYDDYQSIEYEIVDGDEFASVDPDTGEVTGLKQGTATVKVTIIDTNGEEISDEAEVNVLGIGITKASLEYDDVAVGETVDPDLDISPSDYDDYQSIKYEVVDGEEFAEVDPDTGEVTGLDKGTATIRVTIIDTNGEEVTAEGTVNVYLPVPTLAANCTWFDPATELTYEYDGYTYNYGRGNIDYITIKDKYVPTGAELISWDASEAKNQSVMAYVVPDSNGYWELILSGNGYGKIYANKDSSLVFSHSSYDDDYPSDLFWGVQSISGLELLDTSNATTMKAMFAGIDGMTSLDLSLSSLNTKKVTDMSDMFKDVNYIETLDVSGLDTANVTTMSGMFDNCFNLASLDLSMFNTVNVTDMSYMFSGNFILTDLDISSFNTGKVTNMEYMFVSCFDLADIDFPAAFTTSEVVNMGSMFAGCEAMTKLDLTQFDTAKVENMSYLFSNCDILSDLNISSFDTSNVTDAHGMFNGCAALTTLDLTHFVTNKVENMSYMFNNCTSLTTIYATHRFSTNAVTNSESMFRNASVLVGGAGTAWNKNYVDKTRALVDSGTSNPGYFTNNIFLAYEDVNVGDTTNAQLTIKSAVFDAYNSIEYKIISGSSYATVNATTGTVTGVAAGTATIQVTLGAPNGDTITAQAPVTVINPVPTLAAKQTWYTQGSTTIDKSKITSINIVDSYDISGKTIIDDWDASAGQIGTVTAYVESDGSGSTYKLTLSGNGYGKIFANTDSSGAFRDFTALTAVNGANILDTSNTTTMRSMFNTCSKLTTLDTSTWETSKVENMGYMFVECKLLKTVDVSGWTTSNVTDMDSMFSYCYDLNSLDVSGWETGNVTTMQYLFNFCESLPTVDVANWDVSNVTDTSAMFQRCGELETLDVSKWTFSTKLVDASAMFNHCESLTALSVENWIMDNVVYTATMFNNCASLTTLAVDNWDVGSAQYMDDMFAHCTSLSSLNVSKWDTSSASNMAQMFRDCPKLTTLAVDNWDVSNVTNMRSMFLDCSGLTSLNVSKWKTTALQYVTGKYGELRSDGETYNWDLGMFEGCSKLSVIDISGWDMDQITNNAHMFYGCSSLESLTIPASLKIISPEFAYNCTSLTEITFKHSSTDTLNMPTAGEKTADAYTTADDNGVYSDGGAFYVPSYLATTVTATHSKAENYDWATDHRAKSIPVLAANTTWYTQDGNTIAKSKITSISIVDQVSSEIATAAGDNHWDASDGKVGTVTAYLTDDGSNNGTYALTIAGNGYGTIFANKSSRGAFSDFSKMTSFSGADILDTSNATSMSLMFYNCNAMTAPPDTGNWNTDQVAEMYMMFNNCYVMATPPNTSNWNTENVEGFNLMFAQCRAMTTAPDTSDWNTDNVTAMNHMFDSCYVMKTAPDTSNWNTANVTNMNSMFLNCRAMESAPDTSNWTTGKVTDFAQMFSFCYAMAETPDTSGWDTANVTDMHSAFQSCQAMPSAPDTSGWNTAKATDISGMFDCCYAMATTPDTSKWVTADVTDMSGMFNNCYVMPSAPDTSGWNTSNVTDMSYMFAYCEVMADAPDTDSWDTTNVTDMDSMFHRCKAMATAPDTSNWNTGNVTNMNAMFSTCASMATTPDTSKWNTENVTNISQMFSYCDLMVTPPDTSKWVTTNVTDMNGMFFYCGKLATAPVISSWDTSKVTNMSGMFAGCASLTSLDLRSFDTSSVTTMASMFNDCLNLTSLDVSSFDTSNVKSMGAMFSGLSVLTSLDISNFDTSSVTEMSNMFHGSSKLATIYVSDLWSVASVTKSTNMFFGAISLSGAIQFDSTKIDATYANYTTGYLTYKAATT